MSGRTFLGILLFLSVLRPVFAAERFALVIGNANYEGNALCNPINDATLVADSLKALDFQVTKKTDLDLKQLEDEVIKFHRTLKKDSAALFYFAGHGLEVKGENYLLPVGADIKAEFQVKEKCYKLDQVLSALESSPARLRVVILDCCRDNPFVRGMRRDVDKQGLAAISDIPQGTIVAFATAPGKTALDSALGSQANSPYSAQLAKSFGKRPAEGLELVTALRDASREVKLLTGQVPWINLDATIENFYLWRDSKAMVTNVLPMVPTASPTIPNPSSPHTNAPDSLVAPFTPTEAVAAQLAWSRYLKADPEITNRIGMKFMLIPPGKFKMGSPTTEKDRRSDEDQVDVEISRGFYLGKYEVTQGEWKTVMGTEPWKMQKEMKDGADYPATHVSHDDAVAYCKKLAVKEGKNYRLPTEAEWEYSCRGGTTTAFSFGGDETALSDYSWWLRGYGDGNAKQEQHAHRVGQKKANHFGLYDMHGNVSEWCSDWMGKLSGGRDPKGAVQGSYRVYRGGSWFNNAPYCRSAYRNGTNPDFRNSELGFRVVLDP